MSQRVSNSLLNKALCINGHDVRDKENAIFQRTDVNGRSIYQCRACQADSQARSRGVVRKSGKYGQIHDLSRTLRSLITENLLDASEADLIAIYGFIKQTLPTKPITDSEIF